MIQWDRNQWVAWPRPVLWCLQLRNLEGKDLLPSRWAWPQDLHRQYIGWTCRCRTIESLQEEHGKSQIVDPQQGEGSYCLTYSQQRDYKGNVGCIGHAISRVFRVEEDVFGGKDVDYQDAEGRTHWSVPCKLQEVRDQLAAMGATPQATEMVKLALNSMFEDY